MVVLALVDSVGRDYITRFIVGFTDCSFWYWVYRCMLVITLLLYVI